MIFGKLIYIYIYICCRTNLVEKRNIAMARIHLLDVDIDCLSAVCAQLVHCNDAYAFIATLLHDNRTRVQTRNILDANSHLLRQAFVGAATCCDAHMLHTLISNYMHCRMPDGSRVLDMSLFLQALLRSCERQSALCFHTIMAAASTSDVICEYNLKTAFYRLQSSSVISALLHPDSAEIAYYMRLHAYIRPSGQLDPFCHKLEKRILDIRSVFTDANAEAMHTLYAFFSTCYDLTKVARDSDALACAIQRQNPDAILTLVLVYGFTSKDAARCDALHIASQAKDSHIMHMVRKLFYASSSSRS